MWYWESPGIYLHCGTRIFRPLNYNSINTTYMLFFFFETEKPLFKFTRIKLKLQGSGKCLFSFPLNQEDSKSKMISGICSEGQGPTASLLLIIQLRQVANSANLPGSESAKLQRAVRQWRSPRKFILVPVILLCK